MTLVGGNRPLMKISTRLNYLYQKDIVQKNQEMNLQDKVMNLNQEALKIKNLLNLEDYLKNHFQLVI